MYPRARLAMQFVWHGGLFPPRSRINRVISDPFAGYVCMSPNSGARADISGPQLRAINRHGCETSRRKGHDRDRANYKEVSRIQKGGGHKHQAEEISEVLSGHEACGLHRA